MSQAATVTTRVRAFRVAPALLLLLLAAGCGQSAPPPPPPAPAPPPAKTGEQRVAWYQDCWKQFNDKSWDSFANCYTDSATSESVDSQPPMAHGRAAIIEADKTAAAAFPDRHGEVTLVLNNGPHVIGLARWLATNDGPMPGPDGKPMPATHKKTGAWLAHTAELDATGSQVTADAVYFDDATMAAQLGMSKAPARKVLTPGGKAPIVVVARNDDIETKNIAAYRAITEAASKHDLKAFGDGLATDYTGIDITMPADQTKKAAIAEIADYIKAFPDMALNATTVWAAGDYVVSVGTFTGKNTGPMPAMGLAKPTGKSVSVRFVEVVKFENGKAKEDWTFYNGAAFASQLGMK